MDCRAIRKLLPASVDHQLTPDEQRNVDAHVQSCSACREELADLRATVAHLRNVEQIEPPPWLTQKIMTRIRAEAAQAPKSFWERVFGVWPMKVPLGAMATVMLAAFVVMIFRSIQPELVRDAVQDVPKQTAPVPESTPQKEPLPTVSRPDGAQKERQAKVDAKKPAMAPAEVQKDQSPELPRAGVPSPAAEQPAKAWKQEDNRFEKAGRYEERAEERMVRTETYKAKKSAPLPASRSAVPGVPAVPDMTVVVADVDAAAGQAREAVLKSGGRVVSSEPADGRWIVIAEIAPEKLTDLRVQLKGLGLVTERLQTAADKVSVSRIRIEIVRTQ